MFAAGLEFAFGREVSRSFRPRLGRPGAALLAAALLWPALACADARQDTERAELSYRSGDVVTAMALLRKAADQGYAPAQARLADLLDAAEQDAEAVALYRKAAEQGDPAGEYGLSRMLLSGEGVTRDPQLALELLRKAVVKDHPPAVDALARAYRAGSLGLTRDLQEAARLEARAKALRAQASR